MIVKCYRTRKPEGDKRVIMQVKDPSYGILCSFIIPELDDDGLVVGHDQIMKIKSYLEDIAKTFDIKGDCERICKLSSNITITEWEEY